MCLINVFLFCFSVQQNETHSNFIIAGYIDKSIRQNKIFTNISN